MVFPTYTKYVILDLKMAGPVLWEMLPLMNKLSLLHSDASLILVDFFFFK